MYMNQYSIQVSQNYTVTSTEYSSNDPHSSHFVTLFCTTNSRITFQTMYTEDYR